MTGASDPTANLDTHWSLGVVLAIQCNSIAIVDSSDKIVVDIPLDSRRGPIKSIRVPLLLWGSHTINS